MKTPEDLAAASAAILAFAEAFDVLLAGVSVYVPEPDDLSAGYSPHFDLRAPAVTVDVERFRENGRTHTPRGRAELAAEDDAEEQIAEFCRGLGFSVEVETGVGSGEYGPINQFRLT